MGVLQSRDPEIYDIIKKEEDRQTKNLVMIASENYASRAVMEAEASALMNKYAEGYGNKRYYGGCEFVNMAEELAISRAKKLFKAEYANVQPHSGAQANMGVYFSLLNPGDTVLGLRLDQGGHLTHGSPVNFSGRFYNFIAYGVEKETELIDYDEVARLADQHKPKLILTGATAYPRFIDFARFRKIADSVGAMLMVDMAHIAGLVAGGMHPSPVPHAHVVTSTTQKTLRGPRGGFILATPEHGQTIDKNVFPGMQGGPFMHVIAAKAVAFGEALTPAFAEYQKRIVENAKALSTELQSLGLRIVTGGTDNHLLLVDLRSVNVTGRDATALLGEARITVNANTIPYDPKPPYIASGIRLGTPSLTSRGMGTGEMKQIARLIHRVVTNKDNSAVKAEVKKSVEELTSKFPVPGITD